jgi:murein L,D-transpeptidase YafK
MPNALQSIGAKAVLVSVLLFFAAFVNPASSIEGLYDLEISKSKRVLRLKVGSKVKKEYPVALGRGGRGDKRQMGDRKTPIGTYRVVRFNPDSPFYYFMQLNYPNVKDAFYGFKDHLISLWDLKRIIDALSKREIPPQDTPLGGAIGIHGVGPETADRRDIHAYFNWTQGCIAMKNADIAELKNYVGIGTKVVINE